MPASHTRLKFENRLVDEKSFNVFKYRNYYNGGGVAMGDVNGDSLPDVYLTSNQEDNKLFLNKGNFTFADVTEEAGVAGSHEWSTGACMVDLNADGRLDIYVCNSGNVQGDNRANELFLNQGNDNDGVPRFKEAAAEYGIDDKGFSTHAAFFDYDRDGDLDLYVLNNAFRALSTFDLAHNLREERDNTGGGHKFYRNENGKFIDFTQHAGIYSTVIAFGLGLSVSDMNNDGWLDIYVANDFFERDYLYLNNHDGTFSEKLEEMMRHVSLSSMGCDVADLNNDGLMEVFGTDMLPENDYRLKTTFTFEPFDFFQKKIAWGYYQQFSQNTLHLNNGHDAEGRTTFSEIALLAGVAATDWSWGALLADLDNDGWKDIFITNGIFRDVTDQDYIAFLMQEENIRKMLQGERIDIPELIQKIPSTKLSNYAFRNRGDLTFANEAEAWGLSLPSFSHGAAYGDLDQDGDLDLVVNNVNMPAFVYRNESDSLNNNHYLKVKLTGTAQNTFALGAKVTLKCANGAAFVQEHMPMRGFQSSVDYALTFGVGAQTLIDTLCVDWPNGARSVLTNLAVDQTVTLNQSASVPRAILPAPSSALFEDRTAEFSLQYRHTENSFNDFQREPFIPHLLSTEGPKIARGDVNGDGWEDLYIGGAKESEKKLLIQTANGSFKSTNEAAFADAKICEDTDAAFFDADNDGDLDLYVVSGGNEYATRAPGLADRLYRNNGRGEFTLAASALPEFYDSGSCVAPADFDRDGDLDLFIGNRSVPWQYGATPTSYLLLNDGKGKFSSATEKYAPELAQVGMVTDAAWHDYDKDGDLDLLVVGEWMAVSLFQNTRGQLINVTEQAGLSKTNGWWNCIAIEDLNGDGYSDFIAGNWGRNTEIRASLEEPATLYAADFDSNGVFDPLLCYFKQGKSYPMPLRSALLEQLPRLKAKLPTHADYAGKQITEIFSEERLREVEIKYAYTFATTIFYGSKAGTFRALPLPLAAQVAPVFAILCEDFDHDGAKDLLLAGNFHGLNPQLGRYDASYGVLLKGNGAENFSAVPMRESGLHLNGQVRDAVLLHRQKQDLLIFAVNNTPPQIYSRKSIQP